MKGLSLKPPFPDKILRLMDPDVRKGLGKHYRTMSEINSHNEYRNERALHSQIRNLLNLKGIIYLEQRMDKKARGIKGWPDFTFSVLLLPTASKTDPTGNVRTPVPVAWELKLPGKKLSPEQEELMRRMTSGVNAWHYRIVHTLQEAADDLRSLGV